MDVLDHAADAPPPKKEGLDGRKGFARRMVLSVIDDVMRLDSDVHGADWSHDDIVRLKDKATRALNAMNNVD
jgi:hypothetical protein